MTTNRWRMGFHLMPPTGWVNDPNGLCYFNGLYHVFHQYSPDWPNGSERGWGHATSPDLVHWTHHGMVIHQDIPEDANGAYSGSAYIVPGGASTPLGALGYVGCMEEIMHQMFEMGLNFDHMVVPSGSAGTHAGIIAGMIGNNINIPVTGIGVNRPKPVQENAVHTLANQTLDLLGVEARVPAEKVVAFDDYVGPGYSLPTDAMVEAVKMLAETEGIPIHCYIFTPGSYPIEDYPGAAQQIARNIYTMAGLRVPVISIISEGGSGGAEAIGLADKRLMLSHGYYSVISPEGGAAILKAGQRAAPELIEHCAQNLHITAQDNLSFGYIDSVVQEPALGARPHHFDFFRSLRQEVLRATDEVVITNTKPPMIRGLALARLRNPEANLDEMYVRWGMSGAAKNRMRERRQQKFLRLSRAAAIDNRPFLAKNAAALRDWVTKPWMHFKYDFVRRHQRKLHNIMEELSSEWDVFKGRLFSPWKRIANPAEKKATAKELTTLSNWVDDNRVSKWNYLSPRYKVDRTITCPNSASYGCLDLWGPDLFAEFAGVCSHCGYHFPMEPEWYVQNVFDKGSVFEFNREIEAGNPLNFPNFEERIKAAQEKTGCRSGCMTFEARIDGTKLVVAMLMGTFRGGSFGAAEGYKFVEAAARAAKKRYPFLAYVHGTAGIRIQEGTHGVIQMPRCTVAVRRYIESGGLYLVLYDTNSFAGPVASFLGCAPYQFAVRSSNIGFAGPGVIKETTGMDIPPKYHRSYRALSRGHIQGIWDRRQIRANLKQALLTMGGRNLYYR